MTLLQSGLAKSLAEDYEIDNSVLFKEGSSGGKLSFTPTSNPTSRTTCTFSAWFKGKTDIGGLDDNMDFEFLTAIGADWDSVGYGRQTGQLDWLMHGGAVGRLKTTAEYRDPSAWYHLVCRLDTTHTNATDRMRMYINGEEVTAFATDTEPTQDAALPGWNKESIAQVVARSQDGSYPGGGYLAEMYMIDGSSLGPDSFGETDSITGQWKPLDSDTVKDAVSFGVNGWFLKFSSTELADSFEDSSGGFIPTENLIIDAMLVGGGGSGTHAQSGGGGGGGMITLDGFAVTAKPYAIIIGAGGLAANDTGNPGGSTIAFGETATGGGGGGINPGAGGAGANGGGGADYAPPTGAGGVGTAPSVVSSLATAFGGFNGGPGVSVGGAGGGGLTAIGGTGVSYNRGGAGGAGKQYNLDGNNYYWGGGGGGGSYATAGTNMGNGGDGGVGGGGGGGTYSTVGGVGGTGDNSGINPGGDGTDDTTVGGSGGANTGGGGGGGRDATAAVGVGGNGGSGIVQIRYASATAKATGGTITTYTDSGTQYQVHTFTSSAGHPITAVGDTTNVRGVANFQCDYLIVGGGGGGGGYVGAGGGAGGYRSFTGQSLVVKPNSVVVGTGGAGGTGGHPGSTVGTSGGDSSFNGSTSAGGGGGGTYSSVNGVAGGSGGGGGGTGASGGAGNTPSTSPVQGYAGGNGGGVNCRGGGGGGAGAEGGISSTGRGGTGGVGVSNSITGAAVFYAGGGGGGSDSIVSAGGNGGGGNGGTESGSPSLAPVQGTDGLGGGGGGARPQTSAGTEPGADGGNGVVIIRYKSDSALATGGTITSYTDGGDTYQVHSFTVSGTFTPTEKNVTQGTSAIEFDGTGDYLTVPDSSDWTFGADDFTVEMWVRFDAINTYNALIGHFYNSGGASLKSWFIRYNSDGTILFRYTTDGATEIDLLSSDAGLTTNRWYHLAITRQSTNIRYYVDGVQLDTDGIATASIADASVLLYISAYVGSSALHFLDGNMDELRISNTCRYPDGTTFTPPTTQFTADSNTKLLIHSDWTGGLGADSSRNYHTFTPANLVATSQVLDSPTNNFSTLNPLINSSGSPAYSEGNLVITPDGSNYSVYQSTISVSSGKWYAEYLVGDTNTFSGVSSADQSASAYGSYWDNTSADFIFFNNNNGNKIIDGAATSYVGSGATVGQIVGVAIDVDSSAINFYINNSAQGSISFSGGVASASSFVFSGVGYAADPERWNFGQDSSFAGTKTARGYQDGNGKGDFYYEPPTDYLALCSDNLPSPEIALPGDHFDTVLWTGNSSTQTVTSSLGFQPDFLWTKVYSHTDSHILRDVVRDGSTTMVESLRSNSSAAQYTSTGSLTTSSNGFSVSGHDGGEFNYDTYDYLTWNWYAPTSVSGSTVSSGTAKTYSGKANADAGFSITKYEGNGTNYHWVPHSLGVTPELAIVRKYGGAASEQWAVLAWSFTSDIYQVLKLDTDVAEANAGAGGATNAAPDSTYVKFGLDDYVNSNGVDMIMYCFASIEGYSKVGSYEGNGNADGTFIYTGFKPAYFMFKSSNQTDDWFIMDNKRNTYNLVDNHLKANTTGAAATSSAGDCDFVSNGVKFRVNDNGNGSGYDYIYLAFAESPFKTSNAR